MTSVLAHAFHDTDAFAVPLPVVAIGVALILLALAAGARRWWTGPPLAETTREHGSLSEESQRLVRHKPSDAIHSPVPQVSPGWLAAAVLRSGPTVKCHSPGGNAR